MGSLLIYFCSWWPLNMYISSSCRAAGTDISETSFATSSDRSSPLVGLQGYIPYPHIAAVCMFEMVNKSWRQHPTRHQLYGHLPPITKTVQVRRTRHAGHCWRSRDGLISDVLLWTPHMAGQKQDAQLEQQLCEDIYIYIHIYQPLHSGKIWHRVNF